MPEDQDLAIIINQLSQSVAEIKSEIVVNRDLLKQTTDQVDRQRDFDRKQYQEIERLKKVLFLVVAAIGVSYIGGDRISKMGDEQLGRLLELAVYLSGATITAAAVTHKSELDEPQNSQEESR